MRNIILILFILFLNTTQVFSGEIKNLYTQRQSNVQVLGMGVVVRILRDDNIGDRHQKFILRLNSGITVLIAHNIDIAQRVNSLSLGDIVEFYGEYEYNSKGGVIHWTHYDPQNNHTNGYLRHNGITYH